MLDCPIITYTCTGPDTGGAGVGGARGVGGGVGGAGVVVVVVVGVVCSTAPETVPTEC